MIKTKSGNVFKEFGSFQPQKTAFGYQTKAADALQPDYGNDMQQHFFHERYMQRSFFQKLIARFEFLGSIKFLILSNLLNI